MRSLPLCLFLSLRIHTYVRVCLSNQAFYLSMMLTVTYIYTHQAVRHSGGHEIREKIEVPPAFIFFFALVPGIKASIRHDST